MQKLNKNIIRKNILRIRNDMEGKTVNQNDIIYKKLLKSDEYNLSENIFTYVSIKNEVDTIKLIKNGISAGKKIAVPKIIKNGIIKFFYINSFNELKISKFGLLEPSNSLKEAVPGKKSLIIIPGVAFDKFGNRLGYGGGYYDRYLSNHQYYKSIALAYSFQIVENLPCENWDVKVDVIINELNIIGKLN